jgi:hypothetical protein
MKMFDKDNFGVSPDDITENEETRAAFVIDGDSKADWAIFRIAQEEGERTRNKRIAEERIAELEAKISEIEARCERRTAWLRDSLRRYMETLPEKSIKKTKTAQSYILLSGTLKIKRGGLDYKRDNAKLLKWAKERDSSLVKLTEEPRWADIKALGTAVDGVFVTRDGELVDGVEVVQKPDTFDVEIMK